MAEYGDDILTGGTASASAYQTNCEPYKACDGNNSTNWSTNIFTAANAWWKYDLGAAVTKTVAKITLKSWSAVGARLKNYDLRGSNNNSNWDTLYSGTYANNTNVQTFTFDNSSAYRYYGVFTTSATYDGNYGNCKVIVEVEMMELEPVVGGNAIEFGANF